VALAGIPNTANIANVRPPSVSAANPWHGQSFVIFTPNVLITLYPPKKVPNSIAVATDTISHKGISSSGIIEFILYHKTSKYDIYYSTYRHDQITYFLLIEYGNNF